MTDSICTFNGDREATLIAYLYDEIEPAERAGFEAHLATCARCQSDLEALGGVRAQLAAWSPPEPSLTFTRAQADGNHGPAAGRERRPWTWREIAAWPAWAQVVAAMVILGVSIGLSAGIANLDIRYDQSGLSVRSGWSRPAAVVAGSRPTDEASGVTRSDLAALEQQLRDEFRGALVASARAPKPASSDADLMRRVKALVDESERRQQRELALRVGEVVREVSSQRQADLRKIDQNIGLVQNRTGVEVLRQREMLNYLVQRVSGRQ